MLPPSFVLSTVMMIKVVCSSEILLFIYGITFQRTVIFVVSSVATLDLTRSCIFNTIIKLFYHGQEC
jgi:hypothetical protein